MADNNSIENADHSSVSLEPDIYISHYCIKHGRCGLCQFDFELNELVIAGTLKKITLSTSSLTYSCSPCLQRRVLKISLQTIGIHSG